MGNAFTYRMPAGIPGDADRYSAGTTIEQQLMDASAPVTAYGLPVVIDATALAVRGLTSGDSSGFNVPYGVLIRPYPIQPQSATNYGQVALGDGSVPPTSGIVDVMKRGYVNVLLSGSAAAVKGAQVYIWTAASSGAHVQGTFEGTSGGGSTITAPAYFVGPADPSGNVQIAWNL
jgi:hypothetical protein